jgi:TolB protein
LREFVEAYNRWADPGEFHDSMATASKQLQGLLSPACAVYIENASGEKSTLTAQEFVKSLNRIRFTQMIHQIILEPPIFEKKKDHFQVIMTKGFSHDGHAEVVECELVIRTVNDNYSIEEIRQVFREPLERELAEMQAYLKRKPYNSKQGLGARYLGGGNFGFTHPSVSPEGDKIVLASLRHNSSEIYIMNSDGSDVKRLTETPYWEVSPSFTPDGKGVFFISDQDNYSGEPYVLDLDNNTIKRLAPNLWNVENICWSPDTYHIAFTATENNQNEIQLMDTNSFEIRQLTHSGREKSSLVFSPEGGRIYFSERWYEKDKKPPLTVEIYSVNIDGSGLTQLTHDREVKRSFAATSNGRILFVKENAKYRNEIWMMDKEGNSPSHLIGGSTHGISDPKLSPDESKVLFIDDMSKPYEYDIYSVNLAGPHTIRQVTTEREYVSDFSFFPDGNHVLYTVEAKGSPERGKGKICIIPTDGGVAQIIGKNY